MAAIRDAAHGIIRLLVSVGRVILLWWWGRRVGNLIMPVECRVRVVARRKAPVGTTTIV